ncbi:SAM-dependent methyltransferase [Streptomyces sp. NPDC007088]|uniref:SAM-dependent methyltransferase n=1 Tax=Streptomyces sp. NPDC007088 TaxID=3364773 RepID=UPI0036762384
MVAAARAVETGRPDALVQDAYARHFVRAAPACSTWPVHPAQVPGGESDPLWGRLGRYFGLRTRVFDDSLLRATAAGARQVVLLGAGLDTRVYRLPLPGDCAVFEIDRPDVLDFKQHTLDALDARPRARRVTVATDLRGDWVPALSAAGFDATRPTAWIAEGLLLYLPSAAERRLIDTIDAHSAPGSSLVYEVKYGTETPAVRDSPVYRAARDRIGVHLLTLFDPDPRPDSAHDLTTRGWHTKVRTPFDYTDHHGRGPRREPDDALAANRWVFAGR